MTVTLDRAKMLLGTMAEQVSRFEDLINQPELDEGIEGNPRADFFLQRMFGRFYEFEADVQNVVGVVNEELKKEA